MLIFYFIDFEGSKDNFSAFYKIASGKFLLGKVVSHKRKDG
jgi:hypothetical protein